MKYPKHGRCLCGFEVGLVVVCMMMVVLVEGDSAKDKEECTEQLVAISTCLPYVSGDPKARTPSPDCCVGMKQVTEKSPKCLCVLIKDRNDPSLGLKINSTLALSLPQTCHAPANISDCPSLLHLPPNSADAKMFEDLANMAPPATTAGNGSSSSSGNGGSSADATSGTGDGRRRQLPLGVEMCLVCGFLLFTITINYRPLLCP